MHKGNYDNNMEILVKGRPISEYFHQGKTYVEGRKGSDYVIRFRNNSSIRKKIVVSVDGLNVITGDNTWHHGYVVNPWATINIPGWRKDNNNVAKFKFSSVGKSYNEHNDAGDVNNVGVIGAKVYHEKPNYYYQNPYTIKHVYHHYDPDPSLYRWNNGNVFVGGAGGGLSGSGGGGGGLNNASGDGSVTCDSYTATLNNIGARNRNASHPGIECSTTRSFGLDAGMGSDPVEETATQSLGTQWGKNAEFHTVETSYSWYATESDTLLIYYDSRDGLEYRGINLRKRSPVSPQAFPFYSGVGCPPPRY